MLSTQIQTRSSMCLRACGIAGFVVLTSLTGCSSGDPATALVSGTVKVNGKSVPGGNVILAPMGDGRSLPGKTAMAQVDDDGTFVMSTYKEGDGAVVGKHRVTFNAPAVEALPAKAAGGHVAIRRSPYDGLVPKQKEFEVTKGGENTLDIELVPANK
jgi:hypothetical protein